MNATAVAASSGEIWPALPFEQWRDTYATLHLWTQIVGKIRLRQTPWINHSWHVTLYVTPRGLTTGPMPYESRSFAIAFDFIGHSLVIETSDGASRALPLAPRSVADFYRELFRELRALGIDVVIDTTPNELVEAIPFEEDTVHASYDPRWTERFWRCLVQAERVLTRFRSGFIGKCSPVHFFWGSFDLAVTRFSGRRAPAHPGGVPHCPDWVTREAYSHEVASCGFWPGAESTPYAVFYAYAYPEPAGYPQARSSVPGAGYSAALREFILPYDEVRTSAPPDATLLAFLEETYRAAADLGHWDRPALEGRGFPFPGAA